jgi:hypothetical protein
LLALIEKIVMGISALLVLGTVAFYLVVGFPSTTSIEFVRAVEDDPAPRAPAASPAAPSTPDAPQPVTAEDQETIKKLAEQGVKVPAGQGIMKQRKVVPAETLEYVSVEANYMPEIKRLRSTILPGNKRIKVLEVPTNSILRKFDIQKGDVIELIDGEIIEFNDTSTLAYHALFKDKIKKVRNGEPVSITVTRNNRPLQIFFRL